ncbi:MAG: Ig-like domain-containing protein [Bacteroidales bacterium]|nr:Ig-like domain-containing protein [Bacteroidales bacterium]
MKKYLPLILALAAVAPMLFIHSCANTTQAPTGGKKDTIPPYIVMISPLPGATNVPLTGAKFKFDFNEYITIKTAQNIFLSPPGKKMPKSKIQGKSLIVTIDDTLKANTTYTINFTDALADNNEGNPYPGYTYVFTTGDHIDSLGITGVVQDCNDLSPVKGATVLLYRNLADSAVFLERPYAAAKTDDWGFFIIPFIEDTLYRLYAIKDEGNNNIYDPDADLIAFVDSLVRPVMVISDTLREFMKYDMTDTLGCRARRTEYELNLFRESTSKQYIKNKVRVSDRAAYITFASADAWIDSLWITGYQPDRIITQFNMKQDSLEIWINDRGPVPDTLNLYVNYRKTDTLGNKVPTLERVKLFQEGKKKAKTAYEAQKNIQHTDTICNFTASARPETVEQKGFELEFTLPVISEMFDSVKLFSVNPRQQESVEKFKVVRDSTNIRKYAILPQLNYLPGYEYILKIPQNCFHDINGYGNDSLEVKASLPVDDALSSLNLVLKDVGSKYIVDLLDEGMREPLRTYIITSDCTLSFPYLKEGKYAIRISDDGNDNSIVDTGNLLEHKQPEKVLFYTLKNEKLINIPASAELTQTINIKQLFNK